MGVTLISKVFLVLCAAQYANAHIEHDSRNPNYQLVTHLTSNTTIEFILTVTTKGWVGVGVGPNQNMTDSDLAITIQGADATSGITTDYHDLDTTTNAPKPDAHNISDWKLTKYTNNGTTKVIHLERLLKTEDPNQSEDITITETPLYVIWAFGATDDVTGGHVEKGSIANKVNLLTPEGSGGGGASDIKGPVAFVLGTMILALAKLI